jgi:hypothetical protein
MKTSRFLSALIAAAIFYVPSGFAGGEGVDFVSYMTRMQYFAHKLGLAVSAQNVKLQGYYVHEVEEMIEKVTEVEEYKGIPVGQLIRDTLIPSFELLEESVEKGDNTATDAAYGKLLEACNACHKAADHAFIHIQRRADNPYMQDFAPIR